MGGGERGGGGFSRSFKLVYRVRGHAESGSVWNERVIEKLSFAGTPLFWNVLHALKMREQKKTLKQSVVLQTFWTETTLWQKQYWPCVENSSFLIERRIAKTREKVYFKNSISVGNVVATREFDRK